VLILGLSNLKKELFDVESSIGKKLISEIIKLINKDREGFNVNKLLIKNLL